MTSAIDSSLGIVAYLALFTGVGLLFIFVNLLVGRFLRPDDPHPEKVEVYECGEPAIGSSFVQFDLRFYVVALLFIIFDVEIAFFFPWATLFGKATHLMAQRTEIAEVSDVTGEIVLTKSAKQLYQEMGVRNPTRPEVAPRSLRKGFSKQFGTSDGKVKTVAQAEYVSREGARQLVWITVADIGVFFAVLMVGFAYVWRRGDLEWVRAVSRAPPQSQPEGMSSERSSQDSILSA